MHLTVRMHLLTGTCDETRDCLSDHVEGELRGLRRRRVLRHLERCERCQAVLESLLRTVDRLRSLANAEIPSPSVADAVVARVRREEGLA
jgi:anti-sigma factor RsiW